MTERLTEKITNKETGEVLLYRLKGQWGEIGDNRMRATKKLGELENAEEEGRLVVLPCKVGDIVYKIMCQRDNFDDRPYRIITSVNFRLDMADDIGKTVFLTREEAEKALKEMEGNQSE